MSAAFLPDSEDPNACLCSAVYQVRPAHVDDSGLQEIEHSYFDAVIVTGLQEGCQNLVVAAGKDVDTSF